MFCKWHSFFLQPWTNLAHLYSGLSHIWFSAPSLFFSAFSCFLSGLKTPFRNVCDQSNIDPSRHGHRKAFSHAFPFFLEKVYLYPSPWTGLSDPGDTHFTSNLAKKGTTRAGTQAGCNCAVVGSGGPSFLSLCCLIASSQQWLRLIRSTGLAPMLPHTRCVEYSWDCCGPSATAGFTTHLKASWSLCSTQYIMFTVVALYSLESEHYWFHAPLWTCVGLFLSYLNKLPHCSFFLRTLTALCHLSLSFICLG